MEIRKLNKQDVDQFIDLIKVFEDVFEMQHFVMPPADYLEKLLAKPDFFVFVALEKGSVIGGLTAYTLQQYYSEKPLAYIYDLAVRVQYQRQGIGKQLIADVNAYRLTQGYEEVFVQADKADAYALNFYRSTHPSDEEQVVHFYYTLAK